MSWLFSFDPAAAHVGWAVFANQRLAFCGLERGEPIGEAIGILADKITPNAWSEGLRIVVEVPQVYQQRSWRGDPNDLISVALTAGRIAQAFESHAIAELVRPHAWKRNAAKAVMLRRIEERLDERERNVLHTAKMPAGLRHNVIDAIGLGLFALDRLGEKRAKTDAAGLGL
jgi:hypothetical protein